MMRWRRRRAARLMIEAVHTDTVMFGEKTWESLLIEAWLWTQYGNMKVAERRLHASQSAFNRKLAKSRRR